MLHYSQVDIDRIARSKAQEIASSGFLKIADGKNKPQAPVININPIEDSEDRRLIKFLYAAMKRAKL